jgi:hypothetical protein
MSAQITKPKPCTKASTEYILLGKWGEKEGSMMASDVFDFECVHAYPKIMVKAQMCPNGKTILGFYNGKPVTAKTEMFDSPKFAWVQEVSKISIFPELFLGFATLIIGIVGAASACFYQQTTAGLSMIGFILAGTTVIVGSKILKKRIESAS